MAVPKRRVRKLERQKKTHYKVRLATPVKDKNGSWKLPHHINKFTQSYS